MSVGIDEGLDWKESVYLFVIYLTALCQLHKLFDLTGFYGFLQDF
jgi:hypothetical protein